MLRAYTGSLLFSLISIREKEKAPLGRTKKWTTRNAERIKTAYCLIASGRARTVAMRARGWRSCVVTRDWSLRPIPCANTAPITSGGTIESAEPMDSRGRLGRVGYARGLRIIAITSFR